MNKQLPTVLAIDTSCDETAAAVTHGTEVLSNIIWSQAAAHADFGGVMPSLAQRLHRERIDWVIERAVKLGGVKIDMVAVTQGPGLAIALEVGIAKAKGVANKLGVPLVPINHVEAHLLSPLATPKLKEKGLKSNSSPQIQYPALGLVVSGGHTELFLIEKIGKYQVLAKTQDDALGEALDKAARMLGLGYPGGAILEKMAEKGDPSKFKLPLPMAGREDLRLFSYSGLKTAFYRLIEEQKDLDKQTIYDLAACFQRRAFEHLIRVIRKTINEVPFDSILVGGGVVANKSLRKILRRSFKKVWFPYSPKLIGDNAAMIGVAAGLKLGGGLLIADLKSEEVDRKPRWSVEDL